MQLSDEQLHILRHMLGINDPSRNACPYRDYAAVNPGDERFIELLKVGAVEVYSTRDRYDWYRTTKAGREAAIASFGRIRWSASKRRYQRFIDVRDVLPDLTFRDFLVKPEFAEARRIA